MLLLGVLMCVSVFQSWRLMPGLLVPYEPKETWQRTRKTCWENSLKYLGNFFPHMLKLDALKKRTLNFILSSCQYLNGAPSRRSPQGCQRWAPHHHRLSVSADLFPQTCSRSRVPHPASSNERNVTSRVLSTGICSLKHQRLSQNWPSRPLSACQVPIARLNGASKDGGLFPWCRGWCLRRPSRWPPMPSPTPQPIRMLPFCCQLKLETKKVGQCQFVTDGKVYFIRLDI